MSCRIIRCPALAVAPERRAASTQLGASAFIPIHVLRYTHTHGRARCSELSQLNQVVRERRESAVPRWPAT
eukprot:scaffold14582_cov108-Isochrysis_galbana.AAC.17